MVSVDCIWSEYFNVVSVDCIWSEWTDWGECSMTCGGGSQSRSRQEVGPFHEGAPCDGASTGTQDCNTHNCPSKLNMCMENQIFKCYLGLYLLTLYYRIPLQ